MRFAHGMCYMEKFSILVISSDQNTKAINPETGSVVWNFTQDVEGKKLDPEGVCCDMDGRVYVADKRNQWLIVLKGNTVELI